MENQILFVKYKDNQPVKIETHYSVDQIRPKALSDVADLIAAYRPGSLLADIPIELLTLHAAGDAEALRPGLSLVDVASGHTDDNPLIIKSKNDIVNDDKMDVDKGSLKGNHVV